MNDNTLKQPLRLKAWLSLLRLPNLFTVPGDAVFAYLVVNGRTDSPLFLFVIFAVISLYMFGLVTNDIADIDTDRRERPSRPLPSGRISMRSAKFAAVILGCAGLIFSALCGKEAFIAGVTLLLLICGYNFQVKHLFLLGPATLALCRMMGLLLGIFAAQSRMLASPVFYPAAIFLVSYIFWISLAAQVEVAEGRRRTVLAGGWLAALSAVAWIGAGFFFSLDTVSLVGEITPSIGFALIVSSLLAIAALKNIIVLQIRYQTTKVPPFIGETIRNLILFQASACAFAGFMEESLWLLVLFIPAWFLSKMFYQS